ncbi:hypothetical protein, partial [Arthrobacter sp. Soil762]|uniref:hypothetical protein n=1 Tax=Arthrobacter sp. Soil762 TaxID=1736401 RepID=UPI001F1DE6A9
MFEVDGARLDAANKLFRKLPSEVKNDLRKYQRASVSPIWKEEVAAKTGVTALSARVFKSGNTVKAGSVITLKAAGSSKKLSGEYWLPREPPAVRSRATCPDHGSCRSEPRLAWL